MQQPASATLAAIDIGSNTIEVLIARCQSDNLEIIEQKTTMVRLGEDVDDKGEISGAKFKVALDTLREYQELAKKHEAEEILAIGTEALREARNSQDFIEAVKRETGIEVLLISGYDEAVLDFIGATYNKGIPASIGVLDVGGGSTEIVTAKNRQINWLTSIPIGSGAIHDRYLPSDPPTHEEMESARSYLASQLQLIRVSEPLSALIVTGSSASSLLKLTQHAFKLDEQGDRLTYEDLSRCEGLLSALKAEEIAKRFEQRLERARVLAAGALIIKSIMHHLQLDEIRVSSHGVREGALLAYTHYNEHWLEEVNSIASKHGTSLADQDSQDMHEVHQQAFADYGNESLQKYTKKLLKWPDAVRQQEDIEDVHKMRVASRRLRAALDAFEPCADPKQFKKINRSVKKLADSLGTVRDTDVMVAGLSSYVQKVGIEEQPGVQWLIDRLNIYHHQETQSLESELQALDEDTLQKQINSCIPKGAAHHGKS